MSLNSVLSVVVPVYNEGPRLLSSLKHFQCLREAGAELIVVDGYSNDESHQLLIQNSELWDQCLLSGPGRGQQMNAGAECAKSNCLFFVHIDSKFDFLPDLKALAGLVATKQWGYCRLRLSNKSLCYRSLARFIHWRSRVTGGVTGDQGICVDKQVFRHVGAFPDIPLMEDVALSDKLKELGQGVLLPCEIETSSRRWEKNGIVKTVLTMWWIRLQFRAGYDVRRLAKKYYPQIDFSLAKHRDTLDLKTYLQQSERT